MEGQLEAILEWAKLNGAIIDDNIHFKYEEGSGIGAYTKDNPSATTSTNSIFIPNNLILTPETAQKELPIIIDDKLILIKIYLAYWKAGNLTHSFFNPYLNLLPSFEMISSPLVTGTDLYLNSPIATAVPLKLKSLNEEYLKFGKDLNLNFSFEDYLWGHLIVTSRAFPLNIINKDSNEWEVMLLPLIDLLNHKPKADVEWKNINDGFKIVTKSTDLNNFELFNNYGPKGNEELLMAYGFTIPNNQFDIVQFTLSPTDKIKKIVENLIGDKLPTLNDYMVTKESNNKEKIVFIANEYHPIPDGMLELFSCQLLQGGYLFDKPILPTTIKAIETIRELIKFPIEGLKKIPKETNSKNDWQNSKNYREGQLNVYNLLKSSLKNKEKDLLKKYKNSMIKMGKVIGEWWDYFESDFESDDFFVIVKWLWLVVNGVVDNSVNEWFTKLFKKLKELNVINRNYNEEQEQVQEQNILSTIYTETFTKLKRDGKIKDEQSGYWSMDDLWCVKYIAELTLWDRGEKGFVLIEPLNV